MKKLFLMLILSLGFVNSSFARDYWDQVVKEFETVRSCVNEVEDFYKFWQDYEQIVFQCGGDYRYFRMKECVEERKLIKKLFEFDSTTYRECAKKV